MAAHPAKAPPRRAPHRRLRVPSAGRGAVPHRARPQPHRPRRRRTWRGSSCCRRTGRSSPTCRFADLVLWLPDRDGQRLLGGRADAAHDRAHGVRRRRGRHVRAARAGGRCSTRRYAQGRLVREGDPEWRDDVPVRVETIPVRRGGRVIAVVARNTNLLGRAHPEPAGAVLPADRRRPDPDDRRTATSRTPGQRSDHADSPAGRRRLPARRRRRAGSSTPAPTRCRSTAGSASPATSPGCRWPTLTRELVPPRRRPDEETLSAVLGGRAHRDTEIGTDDGRR